LYKVTITGGEPLLFMEDVLHIAEESRKLNVPMIVITNGSLISVEIPVVFSKKFV
jgi:pyruvate-formate lyase-activating enzyme